MDNDVIQFAQFRQANGDEIMSKILRSPRLTRLLLLTAVGLVPVGLPLFGLAVPGPCLVRARTMVVKTRVTANW